MLKTIVLSLPIFIQKYVKPYYLVLVSQLVTLEFKTNVKDTRLGPKNSDLYLIIFKAIMFS